MNNNDPEVKEFQAYLVAEAKSLNKDPKEYVKGLGEDGLKEAYKRFQAYKKKLTQKAAHGAKLNYFKSLKNQCAEDEEVVYYRKGGSVECGCKKKEGGEVPTAKTGSAVDKFKARKLSSGGNPPQKDSKQKKELNIKWTDLDDRKLDSLVTRSEIQKKSLTPQGQKDLKALREKFKNSSNKEQYEVEASEQKKCGGKVKKHQSGDEILPIKHPKGQPSKHINRGGTKSHIPVQSCGAKVNKDCNGAVAKFKAKCGSKLKKHLLGGSLNGIPFMQTGTFKGGIKRGINGEYYTNPIPWGAGNGSAGEGPLAILELNITSNPNIITGEAPGVGGITKAKSAWEALQMVKAMKAAKNAKAARQIVLANKPAKINVSSTSTTSTAVSQPKRIKASHGYTTELEIPNIPNYQELYNSYKMTKASRLNMNNVLEKLSEEERANVLKVIMGNPDKYINVLGNITPAKASGIVRGIRKRIPGEYTSLRVKSLDLTKPSMRSGVLGAEDATSHTAGFKRTTNKY